MKTSVRAGAIVFALATVTALVVPFATSASAAGSVSCSKLVAALNAQNKLTTTLSSCTPTALKAGATSVTKVVKSQKKGTVTDVLTWKGGKGTTTAVVKYGAAKGNGKCAKGEGRVAITGTVTGGTGAAAKIIKKGEKTTASICAFESGPKTGQSRLEPGTKFVL